MNRLFKGFLRDRAGATAIEYGLLTAIISVALLGGLGVFSEKLNNQFLAIANIINNSWAGQ